MSRHSRSNIGAYYFFFVMTFILGAILPLIWLWFLPNNSKAFNTLATSSNIRPYDSLILIEFFGWVFTIVVFMVKQR